MSKPRTSPTKAKKKAPAAAKKAAKKTPAPAKKTPAPAKKAAKQAPSEKKSKFDPRIVKAHQNYVNAINSNETARVMAMYDKDAVVMPPGAAQVQGHANIRKWVADYFNEFETHWVKESKVIWVAGDFGFDQGIDHSKDISRKTGKVSESTVKGILIYKRQTSGEWLVYRDIWNSIDGND